MRQRPGIAVPAALMVVALLGVAVVLGTRVMAKQSTQPIEMAVIVTTSTPTTTPTPAPSPTPAAAPTPVRTPPLYFPPPPPHTGIVPANQYGLTRISAPTLRLDHYIEIVGVVNGEMQSPIDGNYSVGFYPDFPKPGQSGNAIFSAHETWNHLQGPFYQVHQAKLGESIFVNMADGRTIRYQITSNIRYDINKMPMGEILNPSARKFGEEWITLITCGGRIVYDVTTGFGEYLDRDVFVAKRVA